MVMNHFKKLVLFCHTESDFLMTISDPHFESAKVSFTVTFVFLFCIMVGRRFSEYAFFEHCFITCILWIQIKLFIIIDGEESS